MNNSEFEDMLRRNIDYSAMPRDCIASAAQRMREDYMRTGRWSARDERIVLGDSNKGVSLAHFEKV
jgi:hypothetical protein